MFRISIYVLFSVCSANYSAHLYCTNEIHESNGKNVRGVNQITSSTTQENSLKSEWFWLQWQVPCKKTMLWQICTLWLQRFFKYTRYLWLSDLMCYWNRWSVKNACDITKKWMNPLKALFFSFVTTTVYECMITKVWTFLQNLHVFPFCNTIKPHFVYCITWTLILLYSTLGVKVY